MDDRGFEPEDPAFAKRVRDSFGRQGYMQYLGVRLVSVRPGSVDLKVDFTEHLSQNHGYFHGGVVAALADVAGGYAAYTLLPAGASNLTVEFKLNLLAPAKGQRLSAQGRVLRAGRTLTVCRCDVHVTDGSTRTLCATALGTFMAMPGKAERDAPPD